MIGERRVMQETPFCGVSLERHVPNDHLLRKIDRFVDLSEVRTHLEPYYSEMGRPSIDSELSAIAFGCLQPRLPQVLGHWRIGNLLLRWTVFPDARSLCTNQLLMSIMPTALKASVRLT